MVENTASSPVGVIIGLIVGLALLVLMLASAWKLYEKAGKPGWAALVPIYNTYVLFEITWGKGILFLLMFVPIANFVVSIITIVKLAKVFGKGVGTILLLLFCSPVGYVMHAFGSAEYIGIEGKKEEMEISPRVAKSLKKSKDNDEDDEEPKKKPSKKPVGKPADDEEDDDDKVVVPKTPKKKPAKAPEKQAKHSGEDENEQPKLKKKAPAAPTPAKKKKAAPVPDIEPEFEDDTDNIPDFNTEIEPDANAMPDFEPDFGDEVQGDEIDLVEDDAFDVQAVLDGAPEAIGAPDSLYNVRVAGNKIITSWNLKKKNAFEDVEITTFDRNYRYMVLLEEEGTYVAKNAVVGADKKMKAVKTNEGNLDWKPLQQAVARYLKEQGCTKK
jgi:hypothetical protein